MTVLTRTCWRLVPPTRLVRKFRIAQSNTHTRCNATLVPNNNENVNATPPKYTKIEKIILDHIKTTGPISFATYMQLCLSHPTDGYYMNPAHKVFGTGGDFITSPEISQTFGELIALWLLQELRKSGKDAPLRLVELGPGKGTLMGDILRVIQKFEPRKKINVHLVETSPTMRELQKTHLSTTPNANVHLHWHSSLGELLPSSSEYTMLVAHEFFDALPVHILQKSKDTGFWHEVLIASNDEEDETQIKDAEIPAVDNPLTGSSPVVDNPPAVDTPPSPPATSTTTSTTTSTSLPSSPTTTPLSLRRVLAAKPSSIGAVLGLSSPRFSELAPGSYLEVSPTAFRIARMVGEVLAGNVRSAGASEGGDGASKDGGIKGTEGQEKEGGKETGGGEAKAEAAIGGCGLIIDYGGAKAYADSLRAFKNHEIVDVFLEPGHCDITANVDFAFLKEAMADLVTPLGPIPQGVFLARMGLGLRLRTLLQAAGSEARREEIHGAAMRLIDMKGMGAEYKVLGVTGGGGEGSWPFVEDGKQQ